MSNINRRIERIEKLLHIEEREFTPVMISTPYQPGSEPDIPEPLRERMTFRQRAKRDGERCEMSVFFTDRTREYEVRNNLPEGMISMHDLKWKIPFTELLEQAKKDYAKDIIDFFVKHKENEDFDRRLAEVEKRLATR